VDSGEFVVKASTTNQSAHELKMTRNQSSYAVIKASDFIHAVNG